MKMTTIAHQANMLLDDVCVRALRQQFDGVKKACCPSKGQIRIDPSKLMDHWKATVSGFDETVRLFVTKTNGIEYPARWNMNKLVDHDKNEILRLVSSVISEEDTPEPNANMYQLFMTICMLCHGSKLKLPSSAQHDTHGLWVAFGEYYPSSRDVIMEQFPRKRKNISSNDSTNDIMDKLRELEKKLDVVARSVSG